MWGGEVDGGGGAPLTCVAGQRVWSLPSAGVWLLGRANATCKCSTIFPLFTADQVRELVDQSVLESECLGVPGMDSVSGARLYVCIGSNGF
jgi:hypothetical protein